jgi:hypothetical protein
LPCGARRLSGLAVMYERLHVGSSIYAPKRFASLVLPSIRSARQYLHYIKECYKTVGSLYENRCGHRENSHDIMISLVESTVWYIVQKAFQDVVWRWLSNGVKSDNAGTSLQATTTISSVLLTTQVSWAETEARSVEAIRCSCDRLGRLSHPRGPLSRILRSLR